jgi:phospholipid transport system substrate-binding protein
MRQVRSRGFDMRLPRLCAFSSGLLVLASTVAARAADPQEFIQHEHAKIEQLLHQPPSGARDGQIDRALDDFVDFDELARRAFGEPCPAAVPACEDLWAKYAEGQKAELKDLLGQLVRKSYRKNLAKTLDYDVEYHGQREAAGDTRVLTEAKSKSKPRDPAVRVDYVVKQTAGGFRVVDIITEGSSLTKNYYEQFRKKMDTPGEGYGNIVQKLHEKIDKKE